MRKKLMVKISNEPQSSRPDWTIVRAGAGEEGLVRRFQLIYLMWSRNGLRENVWHLQMSAGAQHQFRYGPV